MKKILSSTIVLMYVFTLSSCMDTANTIHCDNCNKIISDEAIFCNNCSNSLEKSGTYSDEVVINTVEYEVDSGKQVDDSKTAHTHSFDNATCTMPAKCACGTTQGSALGHSYHDGRCTRCDYVKFETLTYSGSDQGIVAKDINLPQGKYRVLISFEGIDSRGWVNVHLEGDSYEEVFSSVDSGAAKATLIDGPVNNGYLLIDGHDGTWEIIIEAF